MFLVIFISWLLDLSLSLFSRLHPTYLFFPMSKIWPPVYWPPLPLRSLTLPYRIQIPSFALDLLRLHLKIARFRLPITYMHMPSLALQICWGGGEALLTDRWLGIRLKTLLRRFGAFSWVNNDWGLFIFNDECTFPSLENLFLIIASSLVMKIDRKHL